MYQGYDFTDTAATREAAQKKRIREMTADLLKRDGQAFLDARAFTRANVDDLDVVEQHIREKLENLTAAMADTDRLADEHSPMTAAALQIEALARAEFISSLS